MPTQAAEPAALPVLFLVDRDAEAREHIAAALTRRFGADYSILGAGTESDGLALLEHLGNDGARVALIAADLALTSDEGGITFLERAHVIHPHASRVPVPITRSCASWAISGRRAFDGAVAHVTHCKDAGHTAFHELGW